MRNPNPFDRETLRKSEASRFGFGYFVWGCGWMLIRGIVLAVVGGLFGYFVGWAIVQWRVDQHPWRAYDRNVTDLIGVAMLLGALIGMLIGVVLSWDFLKAFLRSSPTDDWMRLPSSRSGGSPSGTGAPEAGARRRPPLGSAATMDAEIEEKLRRSRARNDLGDHSSLPPE